MPTHVLAPDARAWIRRARRTAVRAAAWAVAGQLSLAVGVTAVDALRKRRDRGDDPLAPDDPPVHVEVREDRITTYTYGRALYDDMLRAIDAAQDCVYLASYIWKGDAVGQEFKDAVIRAADRGVLVCVVFDGFANLVVPRAFRRFPESVNVLRFPVIRPGLPLMNLRRTGRDHRKILVVDGQVGFVGGYNIGELYAHKWRDTHVRVEGPGVWELQNSFVDFWNRHRRPSQPQLPDTGTSRWGSALHAARNEPSRLVYPVRALYLEAIDRALDRIWITQGYFIPDKEVLEGLLAAAARGVDVRVIMPEHSNHVLADIVARYYWFELLEGGVHLHLYKDIMVHAKTATVDGQWATIGTANIDRLSLRGNYEINLEVVSPDQAAHMEDVFRRDLQQCEEITLDRWVHRPWYYRVLESTLRPLEAML